MCGLKIKEKINGAQVHALIQPDGDDAPDCSPGGRSSRYRFKFRGFNPKSDKSSSGSVRKPVLPYGLPRSENLEPTIDPYLKPIKFVETLADIYGRLETCLESEKLLICMEQYSILSSLGDPKLLRRCLREARKHALDVHSKVVLSAWLRYERREDELEGISSMDCSGFLLECPKASLGSGSEATSVSDYCKCSSNDPALSVNAQVSVGNETLSSGEDSDDFVCFSVGDVEISCIRPKIAALSCIFKAMLYGSFLESKMEKIDFSHSGVSVEGLRAVELYSRTRNVDTFCPEVVLELLSFANRYCCEEMKSTCDAYLVSLVGCFEDALILIEYGLEERAELLVASCLQVFLRALPSVVFDQKVMQLFCSSEARERLASAGHASFLLYYFLSQVAMEENMVSSTTIMLLKRLLECATEKWQKALSLHQLGCVMLERRDYRSAEYYFQAASEAGHVYSSVGLARSKYKQGRENSAFKLMNSLVSEYKAAGWMYQERSLYSVGKDKMADLEIATGLDPTLVFPYKYRAIKKAEEKQIKEGISEIDKIIGFKLAADCLELRAWLFIATGDYESALRDIRAMLTLEPNYSMLHGKMSGDHLIELLNQRSQPLNQADCWVQLYDRWSSVDDIGSLAVIHQMLDLDPGKSLLMFRQSLLLLRLNCHKAAMRCLRLACKYSDSEHERLVYEGWILYDTGYREEAIARAEKSILDQRSFEALFLKAYALADTKLDPESASYVIKLLEEALKCPSDGLRKGQALNNLGSMLVDYGTLDQAEKCYRNAMEIMHTRAHQGLARVYYLRGCRKAAYDEMTKLIEKALNKASAYEKRSEYCDRDTAKDDLNTATQLDPLRTYPYRYRAAVLMDELKETEAVEELTTALAFKTDLQMLHLRAAFFEAMGDVSSAIHDCQAALCLDPNHKDTVDLYNSVRGCARDQEDK